MIVRCGRCRSELEVSGPGEFICPTCGTRNAVRGDAAPAGLDLGLTVPGGTPRPPSEPSADPPDVHWSTCPSCAYRFAMGTVEAVTCPNCAARLEVTDAGLKVATGN